MSSTPSRSIYLKDYAPPAWLIDTVDLHVAIHDAYTEVRGALACRRNPAGSGGDLVLDGEDLALQELRINGAALAPSCYTFDADRLTISSVNSGSINGAALPDRFTLETRVRIEPDRNTQLSGRAGAGNTALLTPSTCA